MLLVRSLGQELVRASRRSFPASRTSDSGLGPAATTNRPQIEGYRGNTARVRAVSPGAASVGRVLPGRNNLDLDRRVLVERVDRELDPIVSRCLDADERLSIADIMGEALTEIPENDRTEERGFELGFHRRWDGADFPQHLEHDVAGRHTLGLQTIAGVLGNPLGLEHPDNNSRRHFALRITEPVALPERFRCDKARGGRVRVAEHVRLPFLGTRGPRSAGVM